MLYMQAGIRRHIKPICQSCKTDGSNIFQNLVKISKHNHYIDQSLRNLSLTPAFNQVPFAFIFVVVYKTGV